MDRLKNFQPHPPLPDGTKSFQERFMRSRKRIRLACAGNQSGKTTMGAAETALLALGEHPFKNVRVPNKSIIVTAKSHKDGIEDEIVPKLKEVIGSKDVEKWGKDKQGRISTIFWRSGSITHLMSAEQDDVAFESKTTDFIWVDEPVRRSIYVALRRGLMKSGGMIYITATPLEEPWMYEEIYLKGEQGHEHIEIFEGSTDENTTIKKEERDLFFDSLTKDEVEARRFGKFKHMTGRVFKNYEQNVHRIENFAVPQHWPVWASIDPHPRKPHAVLWMTIAPNGLKYFCNEIFRCCSIDELADEINYINEQYNMVDIVIDTSAQQDDWRKQSAREMLTGKGVFTRLAQKKNVKKSGIILLNQLFKSNQLYVFDNCVRLHKELSLQIYKNNKRDPNNVLEEPMKQLDDQTDNARYILIEKPEYEQARIITYA